VETHRALQLYASYSQLSLTDAIIDILDKALKDTKDDLKKVRMPQILQVKIEKGPLAKIHPP
jgi:hypothetical protein